MTRFWLLVFGILLLLAAGCGPQAPSGQSASDGRLKIVATTSQLADAARVIAGDAADVSALMGPGVDPHLYKPTPRDLDALSKADLIVVHGLDLEGKMGEVLESLKSRGRQVFVAGDFAPMDRLILAQGAVAKPDPHIWNDPLIWSEVVLGLGSRISKLASEDKAEDVKTRSREAARVVRELQTELKALADQIPKERRVLVTAHDAFAYFGRSFGFEVHGIQGISTATEASAPEIAKLADLVASRRVKAVFVESSVPRAAIEALLKAVESRGHKARIGGELYSDALGAKGSPGETYMGMMRANMKTVVEALK